jgi:cytochrome c5
MRSKIFGLLALTFVAVSCASKKVVAPPDVVKPMTTMVAPKPGMVDAKLNPVARVSGKNLYESNCAKCHTLHNPTEFTQQRWNPILLKMQRKAKLDDNQMIAIKDYIFSLTKE